MFYFDLMDEMILSPIYDIILDSQIYEHKGSGRRVMGRLLERGTFYA